MNKIVTGIDIGTYHVKVVIAEQSDDPRQMPRILGTGYAESRGIKQGYIISKDEVSRSVAAAVAQASRAARVPVRRAHVGIGGIGLDEAFSRGEVVVERGDSEVTDRDIPRAIAGSERGLPPQATLNRRVLHTIPLRFYVDGVRVMGGSPVGMKGQRVAVETLFITCLEHHVHDLVEAVERGGVEVEDIVASPLASSFVALTKMQQRVGCVLVDIGAETLGVLVFEDGKPISIKLFPIGGSDITNDLALALRISPEEAEELKRGAVIGATFPKKKIDDIIARRLMEMFKLVDTHLKKTGKSDLLPAGAILTGGGASIAAAQDVAKATLRLPCRVATLSDGNAAKMQLGDGIWAVAYGLTVWGMTSGGNIEHQEPGGMKDVFKGFWRWFKRFLP